MNTEKTEASQVSPHILIVPIGPDWTKEHDVNEFIARFGEPDEGQSLRDFGFYRVYLATRHMDYFVTRVLHRAVRSELSPVLAAGSLSFEAKCGLLEAKVRQTKPDQSALDWFLEALNYCRAADKLKEEVMAKALQYPDLVWLLELADAADHLGTAMSELDDALNDLVPTENDWTMYFSCCLHDEEKISSLEKMD